MLDAPTTDVAQACAALAGRERRDAVREQARRVRARPGRSVARGRRAPRLREDFSVLGLSPSQARALRDRLARSSILLEVGRDDELVHAPAQGNGALALADLLACVREWMLEERLSRLVIVYGDTPYEAELRADAAPAPEDVSVFAPSAAGLGSWVARTDETACAIKPTASTQRKERR